MTFVIAEGSDVRLAKNGAGELPRSRNDGLQRVRPHANVASLLAGQDEEIVRARDTSDVHGSDARKSEYLSVAPELLERIDASCRCPQSRPPRNRSGGEKPGQGLPDLSGIR
jgi:hypothetical protein